MPPLPPIIKRAVRVKNIADAKKLLSKLMTRVQKEDIDPKQAGLLNYLISTFIQLQKYIDEREWFREVVHAYYIYILEGMKIQVDNLKKIIASNVNKEQMESIYDQYDKESLDEYKKLNELHKIFLDVVSEKSFNGILKKREEVAATKIKAQILHLYNELDFSEQAEIRQTIMDRN